MPKKDPKIPFINIDNIEKGDAFFMRPIMHEINALALGEKPHRHNFQEILWVKQGKGKHQIDGQVYELKEQTVYFISQYQIHYFLEGHDLEGYLIRYKNDFLPQNIYENNSFAAIISKDRQLNELQFSGTQLITFEILLHQLFEEYQTNAQEVEHTHIVQHIFYTILLLLQREAKKKENVESHFNDTEKKLYTRFLTVLENQFHKQHEVGEYAFQMGVSKRKLATIVQEISGKSAKHLITERIVLEAKRLLLYSEMNLKEISYTVGFEDLAYFCRLFKNQTLYTPSEFRTKKIL